MDLWEKIHYHVTCAHNCHWRHVKWTVTHPVFKQSQQCINLWRYFDFHGVQCSQILWHSMFNLTEWINKMSVKGTICLMILTSICCLSLKKEQPVCPSKRATCVALKRAMCLSLKKGNLCVPQKSNAFVPQKGQSVCPPKRAICLSLKKGNLSVPQNTQSENLFCTKWKLFDSEWNADV